MSGERYVVLGLAHARSHWFMEVAHWATSGAVPVEFVKCVSVEEALARLASGRPFSAALLDARLHSVDRDLLATMADANVASIVVGAEIDTRNWRSIGAAAHLPASFDRAALLETLASHGRLIGSVEEVAPTGAGPLTADMVWRGPLIAVTGRCSAGASTVSAALAQRLAQDPRYRGDVLLVDLVRRAHQAVLHDARDVVPGIQEVIEAHRSGRPSGDVLRRLAFEIPNRGYRLVLGLRRPRDWVTVRSSAFGAALDGLRSANRIVVADTDPELEGEAETGSTDIEDRHLLGRITTAAADLVVVVANPTVTGVHSLVGQLQDLSAHGVEGRRTLVVFNRAPKANRAKAELTRALASLTGAADRPDSYLGPIYLPERRGIDAIHRDLAPLPSTLTEPIGRAVVEIVNQLPTRLPTKDLELEPVAVVPGSLGHWEGGEA